jgi:hypothetical protein
MKRLAAGLPILLVVLLVLASTTRTQSAPRLPRIGMLCVPACSGTSFDAFWEGLRELGWVEGTTVVIDRKEAGSRLDELPILAAHLVQSKPDLIVTLSPQAARAAKDATSQIPIVMTFIADPIGMGLASSLAHPGGNATGVASLVPGDFDGKVLEIIRELLPKAQRVAAFINPSNDIHRRLYPKEAPPAPPSLDFSSTRSNYIMRMKCPTLSPPLKPTVQRRCLFWLTRSSTSRQTACQILRYKRNCRRSRSFAPLRKLVDCFLMGRTMLAWLDLGRTMSIES